MRDTSSDAFWGAAIGGYLYEDKEPGCLGYSFGFFALVAIVGSIFSFIEEGIIDFFGDSWDKLVVPHIFILLFITFLIIFLENRALNKQIKSLQDSKPLKVDDQVTKITRAETHKVMSYKSYRLLKMVLYIFSFVIGYAVIVGLDIQLFSDALYDKSEETNGTLFPWIFWIVLHFLSIPIEFFLKLAIVPFIQFLVVKIVMIPIGKPKRKIINELKKK